MAVIMFHQQQQLQSRSVREKRVERIELRYVPTMHPNPFTLTSEKKKRGREMERAEGRQKWSEIKSTKKGEGNEAEQQEK
ncbi:hypothetical protein Pcinc_020908 [Petrolisthes cinctipes]|uniref:Uncharacterized protein n=1 Tax=Petrolisthes cinctipes TaxID=88211 RepID=A0AAE1KJ59_PETCI|nr:hypothetical protein Pcinc_020908 [Petrolisthes cinctipes]